LRGFCLPEEGQWPNPAFGPFGKFWANHPPLLAISGHANAGRSQPLPESRTPSKPPVDVSADVPSLPPTHTDMAASHRPGLVRWSALRDGRCAGSQRPASKARAPPEAMIVASRLATLRPARHPASGERVRGSANDLHRTWRVPRPACGEIRPAQARD
jgi:hypothetical protein